MIFALIAMMAEPPPVPNFYSGDTSQLIRAYGWCLENKAIDLSAKAPTAEEAFESAKVQCADIRQKAHDAFLRDELRWPMKSTERAEASTNDFLKEIETIAKMRSADRIKAKQAGAGQPN